nr:MAG TPA: hypothetical protein [Caudoviricetes sp.]DAG60956.1 MAG TPA: hypothetical protein [Caudoviricetes sp.]DAL20937.1 MAG TPA_asm: hypothetical protein [Caudoviricetes sp.]DAN99133.1 MAG TPA: hypothetical protein [Caudoviricetes sp.]DAV75248.1 MAG TPA: hypothetical protein [Caudoviricetes sp.]
MDLKRYNYVRGIKRLSLFSMESGNKSYNWS